ncbi:MOG interacting and ectopic P-granules protein 1 isoform X2 [Sabethes cyaneus]|uniref:MOG interacting and ectopic P-granules protein 1 isoform X2 n=1 Tax=Sabethes cyaneus TaxID=53552 RepID=UPI00237E099B|nr:MOG interacting and ectopic P-granules protein 1 isoform X2 [Sabethes cyaneus]
MGEVGMAANEHPTSDEVKENGEINGNSDKLQLKAAAVPTGDIPKKAATPAVDAPKERDNKTKATAATPSEGSELDESSQTSRPISSNGQTEGEEDDTSQGAETEESRPEVMPIDSENQDTVESMEVDGEETVSERKSHSANSAQDEGKDPLEDGESVENSLDAKSSKVAGAEVMDVDAPTNGHSAMVPKTDGSEVIDDDSDDKPVSINSDSENEDDRREPIKTTAPDSLDCNSKSNDTVSMSSKSNGDNSKQHNGDCDNDVTILSDKEEDCVVIDDEDGDTNTSSTPSQKKMETDDISPRRSSRARKSMLPQDISTIDDDDDIEEIIDDPLNIAAAKKPRLSINQSLQQNSFKGQLPNTAQPQKSLIASAQNSATKEPTLVIIDTNSLINRSNPGTPKSINSSYSSLPSGMSPNSSFNSPRSVLNPMAAVASNLISKTNPPPLAPVTPLLPALTDDMFVLEAPSFIVPYIYEKPPQENLRDIVNELESKIKEIRKKLEETSKEDDQSSKAEEDISQDSDRSAEKKSSTSAELESEQDKKKKSKRKPTADDDEEWDELNTSTDEEASDEEQKTKVLIKEVQSDIEMIKEHIITPASKEELTTTGTSTPTDTKKSENYFENPLGKFFMNIGINLVQEYVQTDLLRQHKKKRDREGKPSASTQMAINSLMKNLELSKENNKPFKYDMKRCEYCSFKSESALAMAHHYETPHMRNYVYKCNFCSYETRPPHDILYHMEAIHNIKGRLEKAAMYHACPNCPFEDNGKSKLARHAIACAKKFRPEVNLNPPIDWEPPAKIPRIKPKHGLVGTATAYQAMTAQQQKNLALASQRLQAVSSIAPVNINNMTAAAQAAALRARTTGRPQPISPATPTNLLRTGVPGSGGNLRTSISPGMVIPNNFQLSAAAIAAANKILPNSMGMKPGMKPSQQPSISITPLPRQTNATNMAVAGALSKLQAAGTSAIKPGQNPVGSKTAFVVCEICDGYIKDLDQLRNHMQWIHKVKIHPKMIYNRPPLNCQKCQYRFFTDQGLERHLLGSHGLVTSSMQEAANKGKDAGRCPVCGRVYQWKLLNHVSRDHNMTLKPAHLSYKCTVCTATFGMYKQFESHVYSAHSTVAKKALDNKKPAAAGAGGSTAGIMPGRGSTGDSLLKPLKINDEITIIPQPTSNKGATSKTIEIESHVID